MADDRIGELAALDRYGGEPPVGELDRGLPNYDRERELYRGLPVVPDHAPETPQGEWALGALAAQDAYRGGPEGAPFPRAPAPQDPFERAAMRVRRSVPVAEKPAGYAKGLEALATVAPLALAPYTGIPAALASMTPRAAATLGAIAAPVGAAALAPTAQHAFEQSERLRAGLGYDPGPVMQSALTAMTGAIPFAAKGSVGAFGGKLPTVEGAPIEPIRAYHGSPHDFERFDISKIGTGEGAQAYGHGLYFAGNEAVAKQYRDLLGTRHAAVDDPVARAQFWTSDLGSPEAAIKHLEGVLGEAKRSPRNFEAGDLVKTQQAIDYLKSGGDLMPKSGHMYEVNINARPEQMLNYDVPIKDQSPAVKEALSSYLGGAYLDTPNIFPRSLVPTGIVGSKSLANAGIPGIKYLDQGSRFQPQQVEHLNNQIARLKALPPSPDVARALAGREAELAALKPTSNYVVFNDQLIDILRKYGIAGAAPAGMGALAAQDQYAQ